jgi:nucleotide-binding universal stress UspA family protein
MKRFKNILVVPAIPSADDAALKRAKTLADSNAARMTVLWPLEESSDGGTGFEYVPDVIHALADQLEAAAGPARETGLPVDTRVRVGRPFVEVIRQVLEGGHDLVMKTARGREIRPSLFFGSTALHLLRKCPCPVWIVNPDPGERAGVLAAVDPDSTDETIWQLNRTIMELATSMSILEGTDLHVLHAWGVPHEDMIRHSPWLRVSRAETDKYVKDIEERHRERFVRLTEEFRPRVPKMQTHFVKGLAEDVIPTAAKAKKIEVVVMATLARSGIPGLLIGNTAEGVLNQVDCSVLAIKPEGFASPITA